MKQGNELAHTEHRVARGEHTLFALDYPGKGPAFVMLHGFPDNHHIYDRVIPYLVQHGRRVIVFDFLGFGASDKPQPYAYSFAQQLEDLRAVADYFHLDTFSPVAHDSGGVAALRYVLAHPKRIERVFLLNTFFGDSPSLRFPEFIGFFADTRLAALSRAVLMDPQQFTWLLAFQNKRFKGELSSELQDVHDTFTQPIVAQNFTQMPSAGPAFAQVTAQLYPAVEENTKLQPALKTLDVPVTLLWGTGDSYLNTGVAESLAGSFKSAALHTLEAGHWPQIDRPQEIADRLCLE